MKKNKLLLIDGNSLFYKSYYASVWHMKKTGVDNLGNGVTVNGVRSFATIIINLKEKSKFSNHSFLVAFDERDTKTYRHEYSFYKAGRPESPKDFI